MAELLYIIRKYWSKHKKSAAALLFSGVLLIVVVSATFFQLRAVAHRELESWYDAGGKFDVIMKNAREEFVQELSGENTLRGEIYVLGKVTANGKSYTYGFLDDPCNIAHIPLESGRLPQKEGEIAIDRGVLDIIGYLGKTGDTIELDMGKFTLVGIIDKTYGENRQGSEIAAAYLQTGEEFVQADPIPLIYVAGGKKEAAKYSFTMLSGLPEELTYMPDSETPSRAAAMVDEEYASAWSELPEKTYGNFSRVNNWDHESRYAATFKANDVRLMLIWAIMGGAISVFSVLSVLRNIFTERRESMEMLCRIGLSKRKKHLMYAVECFIFIILQTVIGIGIGMLCHLGMFTYQVKALDMAPFSGFTTDHLVTDHTASPYLVSCIISAVIMPLGYLLTGAFAAFKKRSRKRKKAASLDICLSRTFRTTSVSIIQAVSLTLICFAAIMGYMFFSADNKVYLADADIGFEYEVDLKVKNFGQYCASTSEGNNDLSFEEDGIAEYYSAPIPNISEIGNFRLTQEQAENGIGDDTAAKLKNAVSTGQLDGTFIISDKQYDKMQATVNFSSEEEREYMISITEDEYRYIFDKDKYLYPIKTALADENTIKSLRGKVVSGELDFDKINSGEQVVLVTSQEPPLNVGDKITLASAKTLSGTDLSELASSEVTIGAVIDPKDTDKLTEYAVTAIYDYCLLTTASGAKAIGLHNASYTEIFAKEHIDGGLIPQNSGMTLTTYEGEKKRIFLEQASRYGSELLIVLLMSLLGFAAYFNGIGMKIRLKEYQISTLHAIGMPIKKLRKKLTLYSLKLPVISCAAAWAMVKAIQAVTYNAYSKAVYIQHKYLVGDSIDTAYDVQEKMISEAQAIKDKYFLDAELWRVHTAIPMLIIFAVMCVITILLARLAFRSFGSDISQSMSKGRKRQ